MLQVIYFSFCFAFSFAYGIKSKNGPNIIILSLLILLLIPPDAAFIFTGASYNAAVGTTVGLLRVHPMTIFITILFFLFVLFKFSLIKKNSIPETNKFIALHSIFITIILILTFIQRGMQGSMQIWENYVGPLLFFVVIITVLKSSENIKYWVRPLLYIGVFLSLFSVFEYFTHFNPYSPFYVSSGSSYSFYYDTGYRCFTTIGHPLNNGFVFLSLMPFVFILKSKIKQLIVQLVLLIGIIVSGARVSSVVAVIFIVIYNLWIVKHKNMNNLMSKIIIVLLFVMALAYLVFFTAITDTLFYRIMNESSSSEIRYIVLNYFYNNAQKYLFSYSGIGGSSDIQQTIVGGQYSFEIPWLILLVEAGLIPLLIYIWGLIYPVYIAKVNRILSTDLKYYVYSFVLMLFAATTYSSFGVKSHMNYLVFGCAAVIMVLIRDKLYISKETFENEEEAIISIILKNK